MKKSRRILALACICVFLCSMIGCGKNETSKTNAKPTQVETSKEEATPTPVAEETTPAAKEEETTPTAEPEATETPTPEEVALPENVSLKDIYAEYGIKVGTCMNPWTIQGNDLESLVTSQFNSGTMENQMKPEATLDQAASKEAGDLVVKFNDDVITVMKWAKEHDVLLRGHTLVWYSQTPQWIFRENFDNSGEFVDRDTMIARMESYIKQVFATISELGYSDIFYAYDVVNEAIMEDGSFRSDNNPWMSVIGEDYIWYAFKFAKKYAPENIALFYNDYNEQYKVEAVKNMVATLVDEEGNSLIDGLGMQCHLFTKDDLNTYLEAIKSYCSLGLQIQITEADVGLGKYNLPEIATEDKLKEQGQYYYNLLDGILKIKQETNADLNSITFWGYADDMSWRKEYNPNLYNRKHERKPAYFAAALMKECRI